VMENEALHRHYSEAAAERAQHFDAGIIARQWVDQLKEVISGDAQKTKRQEAGE